MKHVLFIAVLFLAACTTTQSGTPRAPAGSAFPDEVARFISDREGCEHFAGEEPYDDERRAFINKNTQALCPGIDERLSALRVKYAGNPPVAAKLASYETLDLSFAQ